MVQDTIHPVFCLRDDQRCIPGKLYFRCDSFLYSSLLKWIFRSSVNPGKYLEEIKARILNS